MTYLSMIPPKKDAISNFPASDPVNVSKHLSGGIEDVRA